MKVTLLVRRRWIVLIVGLAPIILESCGHPSDKQLKADFRTHKQEFQILSQMAFAEDRDVIRIAPTSVCCKSGLQFTVSGDHEYGPAVITASRWRKYRELFAQAGVDAGIAIAVDHNQVFFFKSTDGGLGAGSIKGYVNSRGSLAPLLDSLDGIRTSECPSRSCKFYERLDGDWYLFYSM